MPLKSDDGNKKVDTFFARCVAGSEDGEIWGDETLVAHVPASGAALFKIMPDTNISLYVDDEEAETITPGKAVEAKLYNTKDVTVQFVFVRYEIL